MANKILQQLAHSASIEFRGSFVAIAIRKPAPCQKVIAKRGRVNEFSRNSRLRLLKLINKTDVKAHKWTFITLTYEKYFPHPIRAKQHLRTFLKRLYRSKYSKAVKLAVLWRMEFQKRGAPHFHLLIPDCPFLPFVEIKSWWNEIIGGSGARVNIKLLNDRRGAMYYVAKYMAKIESREEIAQSSSFFITVPYLPNASFGRFWGIENRASFPMAVGTWINVTDAWEEIEHFKHYAREHYASITRETTNGFTLFVDDAAIWEELWYQIVGHGKSKHSIISTKSISKHR